jgi:hypothetical protein
MNAGTFDVQLTKPAITLSYVSTKQMDGFLHAFFANTIAREQLGDIQFWDYQGLLDDCSKLRDQSIGQEPPNSTTRIQPR